MAVRHKPWPDKVSRSEQRDRKTRPVLQRLSVLPTGNRADAIPSVLPTSRTRRTIVNVVILRVFGNGLGSTAWAVRNCRLGRGLLLRPPPRPLVGTQIASTTTLGNAAASRPISVGSPVRTMPPPASTAVATTWASAINSDPSPAAASTPPTYRANDRSVSRTSMAQLSLDKHESTLAFRPGPR